MGTAFLSPSLSRNRFVSLSARFIYVFDTESVSTFMDFFLLKCDLTFKNFNKNDNKISEKQNTTSTTAEEHHSRITFPADGKSYLIWRKRRYMSHINHINITLCRSYWRRRGGSSVHDTLFLFQWFNWFYISTRDSHTWYWHVAWYILFKQRSISEKSSVLCFASSSKNKIDHMKTTTLSTVYTVQSEGPIVANLYMGGLRTLSTVSHR